MAKTWATKCCSGTYKNNYQLCCGIKVKFAVLAVMLFLVQFSFADTIPTEGQWNEEDYYRSVNTNRPPVASIEGDILSLSFEDDLSNLTVCVMNDKGVKVYEDVVSSEAGGTYSFSLAGEANGQYQVVLLHRLGHLTGSFTLE